MGAWSEQYSISIPYSNQSIYLHLLFLPQILSYHFNQDICMSCFLDFFFHCNRKTDAGQDARAGSFCFRDFLCLQNFLCLRHFSACRFSSTDEYPLPHLPESQTPRFPCTWELLPLRQSQSPHCPFRSDKRKSRR